MDFNIGLSWTLTPTPLFHTAFLRYITAWEAFVSLVLGSENVWPTQREEVASAVDAGP